MKIVVCCKEVADVGLNPGYGLVDEVLWQKGLTHRLNPADLQALSDALCIKESSPGSEITLISLGREEVEEYLREGISLGADRAIRIQEEGLPPLSTYQKSRVLARAISLSEAELVLVGNKSLDSASGLMGLLIAGWLDFPCLCEVTDCKLETGGRSMTVSRSTGKGQKESLEVTLPAVLAISSSTRKLPYASVASILKSREAVIDKLQIFELGISPLEIKKDPTKASRLYFPRPRTIPAPLDSSLPAFERILALLQGGIARRRGEVLRGNSVELANQLYELLLKEEVLKPPARP